MSLTGAELTQRRKVSLWTTGLGLLIAAPLVAGSPWRGSTELHTIMEVAATGLALMVGAVAFLAYSIRRNFSNFFLAVGFIGTGLLDGYHMIVTSQWFGHVWPSPPPSLIPWSWNASRLCLSLLMYFAWLSHKKGQDEAIVDRRVEMETAAMVGGATLLCFVAFALTPLPPAYYEGFVGRPSEFLSAFFFGLALYGYGRKGAWKESSFHYWLTLSLVVGFACQAFFMPFSRGLFDPAFDAAHLLKKVSYLVVLTGLFLRSRSMLLEAQEGSTAKAVIEGNDRAPAWTPSRFALPVLLVNLVGTIVTWRAVDHGLQVSLHRQSRLAAEGTAQAIEERTREAAHALRRMNDRLALGDGSREASWRQDALNYLEDLPSLEFIAWLPADRSENWLESRDKGTRWVKDVLRAPLPSWKGYEDQPFRVVEGSTKGQLSLYLRTPDAAPHPGVLVAGASVTRMLRNLQLVQGYGLDVRSGEVEAVVFRRGNLDPSHAEHVARAPLQIQDVVWDVRTWPNQSTLIDRKSILPELVLTVGTLISILMGLTVFFLVSARQGRRLLQEAHDRLEEKVEERTESLARANKELSRSNDELSRFAHVASHDLQEPLRMVASYTQLLQKRYSDKLDKPAREFIEFAVDGATRMQALIRDLLAFSRLDSRQMETSAIDLNTVMRKTLSDLRLLAEENGVRIEVSELPVVWGDGSQIAQLMQNLVTNAVKYHGEDDPWVKVYATDLGEAWRITVEDNGIGIDENYFEKVFVIFQRLHNKDEYSGTGIGLALCEKIARRHGGKLWLESKPGSGSRFHADLPSEPPSGPEATTEETNEP